MYIGKSRDLDNKEKKKIIDTKDEGYKEATVERMSEVFFYRAQYNEFILL